MSYNTGILVSQVQYTLPILPVARTREGITESLRILKELEEQHAGTLQEARITMLRLLKEKPTRNLRDIVPLLGRSERSLQRWWHLYQRRGLGGLLEIGKPGGKRPRKIDPSKLHILQNKVRSDGTRKLGALQRWLREEHNIEYSSSGLWYLMRKTVGAQTGGWMLFDDVDIPLNNTAQRRLSSQGPVPGHIIDFLNSLPTTGDSKLWIAGFREALLNLLGDIDRITISVNVDCNIIDPESYNVGTFIIQHVSPSQEVSASVDVQSNAMTESHAGRILDAMRGQNYPFASYHTPSSFDYFYKGEAYLGVIILWRELSKPPINQVTLETVRMLEPFLIFALSYLVARHQTEKPIGRVFNEAIGAMIRDAGLSPQEHRIAVLQLMGHSYKEIADLLFVSLDTVKKHFKYIHRKTGTRSQAELFAKYFSSRLKSDEIET